MLSLLQKQRKQISILLLTLVTTTTTISTANALVLPNTAIHPIPWQSNWVSTRRNRSPQCARSSKLGMDAGTNSGCNNNLGSSNDNGGRPQQRKRGWTRFVGRGALRRSSLKSALDDLFLYDDIDGVGSRSMPFPKNRQQQRQRRRRLPLSLFNRPRIASKSRGYRARFRSNRCSKIRKHFGPALVTIALSIMVSVGIFVASGSVNASSRTYRLLGTLAHGSALALYGWVWYQVLLGSSTSSPSQPWLSGDEASTTETTTTTTTTTAPADPNPMGSRQRSTAERALETSHNNEAKIIQVDDDDDDREIRSAFFPPPIETTGRSEMMSF